MQEPDLELEGWQRQWQAQEAVPTDLARAVEAGTRSIRRGIIAEIVVTIVMGGGALGWATRLAPSRRDRAGDRDLDLHRHRLDASRRCCVEARGSR